MTKKIKRVFDQPVYEVTFGSQPYDITAQPIRRIIQFQEAIEGAMESLDLLSTEYYVHLNGGEPQGPFSMEEATEIAGEEGEIEARRPEVGQFLEVVISAPYQAFRVVVPELKKDDAESSTFPELQNAFNVVIEANGIGWLEEFVKKTIAPAWPEIMAILIGSVREALATTTETTPDQSGETP